MEDILKIVKFLSDSGILLKGVSETIKDEAREQKGGFFSKLLDTLGASFLGDVLLGKGVKLLSIRAGKGTAEVGYGSKRSLKKLILPHPLTNFEIQMNYQNEPRFNGVYSRDNLPDKIKNEAYLTNLDQHFDIGTHWVALYVDKKIAAYFDSFGIEYIPKEIESFINNKSIIANIFRI